MKFHLKIYDNAHYMVESAAYNHGQYETYQDAVVAAKTIVRKYFIENSKSKLTAGDLLEQYHLYGEDPVVLPKIPGEHPAFSAWTYANEIHETFLKNFKDGNKIDALD